ncbi:hypothetical protein ILUMI_00459 [Ignelater luminosus]|uniref:DUF243 domain-containing protein n=1 Tax=Ignelater luminosus TaxID=2038154 RepID=A0A8K0GMM1_IGNLU|nr:hypothetical protein ILUMI_00459 [Ignelater luminosus]
MRSLIIVLGVVAGVFALPRPGKLDDLPVQPSGSYLPVQPSGSYLPGVATTVLEPSHSTNIFEQTLVGTALTGITDGLTTGGITGGLTTGGITGGLVTGYTGGFVNGYTNDVINGNLHHDQRHFYFYSAPDDEPAARLRVYVEPTSQRNTKIIFVKAPSYGGVIPEVIAPPSEAVDRTKIYVLVKKPQHDGAVTIPASLGVKQAQPEVFFIKYHNHHEAEAAVNQGLSGAHIGTPLHNLGNEQTFVRTLGSSHGGIGFTGGVTSVTGGVSFPGPIVDARSYTKYGPPGESGPYKKK